MLPATACAACRSTDDVPKYTSRWCGCPDCRLCYRCSDAERFRPQATLRDEESAVVPEKPRGDLSAWRWIGAMLAASCVLAWFS